MKKSLIICGIALSAMLTSCGKHATKDVDLTSCADSLSYAYGATIAGQLSNYQFASDTLAQDNMDKVIDAIVEGLEEALSDSKDNNQYRTIGKQLGQSIQQLREEGIMNGEITLNEKALIQGLVNQLLNENNSLTAEQADEYINRKMRELREARAARQAQVQITPIDLDDEEAQTEN